MLATNHELSSDASRVSASIVPRWEWRVFAKDLAPMLAAGGVALEGRDSVRHEVYFLSANSRDNVKVRDNRLEVKRLCETNSDGLELWTPALTARFPIAYERLHALWDAWRVPAPEHAGGLRSLSNLLNDCVSHIPSVRTVIATKERARFAVGDCRGEHVVLWIDGTRLESIAVEDEDPSRVLAAAHRLGLTRMPNTSYPRALKAALGLPEFVDNPTPEHV